jgi:predicted O-methyltransferase YrrM
MDVTKRLMELDPTLVLHNEGHWDKPLDPTLPDFTSFNDAGIETETGEFLYSFIRMLKPQHVLETGTHIGVGMAYMGQALKDNKKGMLDTVEFLPELYERAVKRRNDLELGGWVRNFFMDVAKFSPENPDGMYGLILLDTEPQTRFAELVKFYNFLKPGGFVFIHDLHRHMHQIENEEHGFAWPYGPIPAEMKQLVIDGKLRPFHFSTPRGFTGFYKVDQEKDYKWAI